MGEFYFIFSLQDEQTLAKVCRSQPANHDWEILETDKPSPTRNSRTEISGLGCHLKALSNSTSKAGSNIKEVFTGQLKNKAHPSMGSSSA